jgi:hypothetical protein
MYSAYRTDTGKFVRFSVANPRNLPLAPVCQNSVSGN